MARKPKPTFWTHQRLKELAKVFKTLSPRQLEKTFDKPYEDIVQAHEFWMAHKRLKITSVQKRKVRFTLYKPVPYFDDSYSEFAGL